MEERKINRLQTTSLMRPMVEAHWDSLRHAKERGQKVIYCFGPTHYLALSQPNVAAHMYAGYAAYCAGKKYADPLFEFAESDGYLVDTCSYHRLHMGMLGHVRKGLEVREDVRLPLPDLCLTGRGCNEHSHLSDSIYRQFGTPCAVVDIPYPYHPEDVPDNVRYVEQQFREVAVPAIEQCTGKKYDYDALSEKLAYMKKVATLRTECMELARTVPSPWTFVDICVSIAPVMHLFGKAGTLEYYQKLKAELDDRVRNKVAALPGERYRLYWDAFIAWRYLGPLSRSLAAQGAILLVGRYPFGMWPHPELIDPEQPLRTLAAAFTSTAAEHRTDRAATDFILKSIKEYSLDGVLMLAPRTCRLWGVAQQDIIEEVERRAGIPGTILELDMIDPKFWSEAQLHTRIQALCEMIEARKTARR